MWLKHIIVLDYGPGLTPDQMQQWAEMANPAAARKCASERRSRGAVLHFDLFGRVLTIKIKALGAADARQTPQPPRAAAHRARRSDAHPCDPRASARDCGARAHRSDGASPRRAAWPTRPSRSRATCP